MPGFLVPDRKPGLIATRHGRYLYVPAVSAPVGNPGPLVGSIVRARRRVALPFRRGDVYLFPLVGQAPVASFPPYTVTATDQPATSVTSSDGPSVTVTSSDRPAVTVH